VSAQPLARKAICLIEEETDERRTSNVQHPTSNKFILSVLKKISRHAAQAPALRERSHPSKFDIRYSAVRCLIQAIAAASLITKKTCHFGVVSHERRRWPEKRPV
jgi:hypothetical protein